MKYLVLLLPLIVVACSQQTTIQKPITKTALCAIDKPKANIKILPNTVLPVSGWIFDKANTSGPLNGDVFIKLNTIDNQEIYKSKVVRNPRPDVVKAFNNEKLASSGFNHSIPANFTKPGSYHIVVGQETENSIIECPTVLNIIIE